MRSGTAPPIAVENVQFIPLETLWRTSRPSASGSILNRSVAYHSEGGVPQITSFVDGCTYSVHEVALWAAVIFVIPS